ncbi:hypothetical protein AKO1_010598 [Acrasis kona]|uniref:Uncharacterized protein n=1 Tax=Acrasis kona TaxID=1008807 RepID=A0AAW2ZIT8_9EUKA
MSDHRLHISPQMLGGNISFATGEEVWSDAFVYPNGWRYESHRGVLLKNKPSSRLEYWWFLLRNKQSIRSAISFFFCVMLIVLIFTLVLY